MTRFVVLLAVCVVAATAAVSSTDAAIGRECDGVPTCIDVPGPWVSVRAGAETRFLLDCPYRRGIVAGLDAQVTSRAVNVTFDGLLGSPVAPGRTTP